MADVLEVTSWPGTHYTFYEVKGDGLCLEIKTMRHALIGLAKEPSSEFDYWIVLGDEDNKSWIKKKQGSSHTVVAPNLLSETQFRGFWLSWHSGSIDFGRIGEIKPLLTYPCKDRINYVTFAATQPRSCVHWKVFLPPILKTPIFKTFTNGDVKWVDVEEQLPDGCMIGGHEKEVLYIIRAAHQGSLAPGKFVPSLGAGFVAWGGESNEKTEFQVLCGYNCTWVPTTGDAIPFNAIVGGHSEYQNERLFVGRAYHKGHLIPGKVQPSHKVCYIPFEGREIAKDTYETLVAVDEDTRRTERFRRTALYSITAWQRESAESSSNDDDDNEDEDHRYDYAF